MLKIFIKTILKKSKSLKCFLLTLFHKNLHFIQIKKKTISVVKPIEL